MNSPIGVVKVLTYFYQQRSLIELISYKMSKITLESVPLSKRVILRVLKSVALAMLAQMILAQPIQGLNPVDINNFLLNLLNSAVFGLFMGLEKYINSQ